MSDDSGSRFTVTLGRGGRVVQRAGANYDSGYIDSGRVSGKKRPIKDRLGASVDNSFGSWCQNHDNWKRQRGESSPEIHRKIGPRDFHLGKGDLRFKLMEKNMPKQADNKDPPNDMDLRDMLVLKKAIRPPTESKGIRHPEPTVCARERRLEQRVALSGGRQRLMDPIDAYDGRRRSMVDPRGNHNDGRQSGMVERQDHYEDGRQSMFEHRDFYDDRRQTMEPRNKYSDGRRSMVKPRDDYDDGRRSILKPKDNYDNRWPSMLGRRDNYHDGRRSMLGLVSSSRNAHDLSVMDRARAFHSSRNLDNLDLRRRSPDGILRSSTSRVISPERNAEEVQRRSMVRAYDDGKQHSYMPNEVVGPPRAVGSMPSMMQHGIRAATSKPVQQFVSQCPQPSGVARKITYPGEAPTVDGFLQSMGLEKYAINFKAEEVDMHALRQMSDVDLKELGIPLGPRKKILQALPPRPKRQA